MKIIELIPVSCPDCKKPITETLPGAEVCCYQCGQWVKVPEKSKG